ncbi:MAG TPA: DUF4292 domain-containing protein [Candidatus Binataceae bacterium]|nr:DUF4292 domain-containing protein [Candidatus Binataceae bacterium]
MLSLAVLSACATQQPPPAVVQAPSADMQALAKRERVLTSLQTAAVMEYTGPNGHVKARERIVIRRPANLRVEVLSPLGVALIVAADANEVAVFDPSKNTITRGAATAATLDRVSRIPLTPEQAARLLLALAPDASMLNTAPKAKSDENGGSTFSFASGDAATSQLTFTNGDLVTVRDQTADGTIDYEVHYSDYRDIGGFAFPHTIEASFPTTATTIKFRFNSPLIDQTIPDSSFVLNPGPQTKELQLGFNEIGSTGPD